MKISQVIEIVIIFLVTWLGGGGLVLDLSTYLLKCILQNSTDCRKGEGLGAQNGPKISLFILLIILRAI
jgi:hypothetical protein